jgi:hypothetical protein
MPTRRRALPIPKDSVSSRIWNLRVEGAFGPLLRTIAALPVMDIEIEEPKLEDVIMKYYREDAQ